VKLLFSSEMETQGLIIPSIPNPSNPSILSSDTVYYFVLGVAAGGNPINYNQIFAASTATSGSLSVNTIDLGSSSL